MVVRKHGVNIARVFLFHDSSLSRLFSRLGLSYRVLTTAESATPHLRARLRAPAGALSGPRFARALRAALRRGGAGVAGKLAGDLEERFHEFSQPPIGV